LNKNIKKLFLLCIKIIALPLKIIPENIRVKALFGFLLIESRVSNPENALKNLFKIKDKLDMLINERALAYEGTNHPKHRLMNYHDYFITNIPDNSKVIDIGCGVGAVAKAIAEGVNGVEVTGIDNNKERLDNAISNNSLNNLKFTYGDALEIEGQNKWDVIVLSNVLEHISERVDFLDSIKNKLQPDLVLIRVPLFERSWEMPMRKELGINYYSDNTHFIEHTMQQFETEIIDAGLKIDSVQYIWGEIWAKCVPA
jgi:2-polyprenyl-3-methyl-5-hydroxy-6-metoxy-1,4-benzoquinol methylase